MAKKKSGLKTVVAAVTGVVVGAGVAVAGMVALKDEKNRVKAKEALDKVKKITKLAKDTGKKVKRI